MREDRTHGGDRMVGYRRKSRTFPPEVPTLSRSPRSLPPLCLDQLTFVIAGVDTALLETMAYVNLGVGVVNALALDVGRALVWHFQGS